jgi:hypothetical protein
MKLHHFTSSQISQIGRLIQKREALLRKIDKIEVKLADYVPVAGEETIPGKRTARLVRLGKTRRTARNRVPGKLKNVILKRLTTAGSRGVTVGDLSSAIKVKPGNIYSWFYTTGKKISGIRKIGPARYAYLARSK